MGLVPAVSRETMNYIEEARKLDKLADSDTKAQEINRLIFAAAKELAEDNADKAVDAFRELVWIYGGFGRDGIKLLDSLRQDIATNAYKINETIKLPESEEVNQVLILKEKLIMAEIRAQQKTNIQV